MKRALAWVGVALYFGIILTAVATFAWIAWSVPFIGVVLLAIAWSVWGVMQEPWRKP